jgi:hypothetical protein
MQDCSIARGLYEYQTRSLSLKEEFTGCVSELSAEEVIWASSVAKLRINFILGFCILLRVILNYK